MQALQQSLKRSTNPNVSSEAPVRGLSVWLDNHLFTTTIFPQILIQTLTADVPKDRSELVRYRLDAESMAAAALFTRATTIVSEFHVAESILAEKTWILDADTALPTDFSLSIKTFF